MWFVLGDPVIPNLFGGVTGCLGISEYPNIYSRCLLYLNCLARCLEHQP